tara:strand:+ start:715 stop:936 length:222 start_codon:yes stop_codon:yes gene_type:complete
MRNYRQEYDRYQGLAKQKKRRAGRNKARQMMIKKVGKNKLVGKDVDHKDRNPNNNNPKNLRMIKKSTNRRRNG